MAVFPGGWGKMPLGVMLMKIVSEQPRKKKPFRVSCGETSEKRRATYYSSSTSFGKWRVQSSSRKQMGRPRRMDIDLSAVEIGGKVSFCNRDNI